MEVPDQGRTGESKRDVREAEGDGGTRVDQEREGGDGGPGTADPALDFVVKKQGRRGEGEEGVQTVEMPLELEVIPSLVSVLHRLGVKQVRTFRGQHLTRPHLLHCLA